MKRIVDTCVWSLWLRRRASAQLNAAEQTLLSEFREAVEEGRAVIVGPIRQETLSGIRDAARSKKVLELLDPFRDEEIAPGDYIEAARLYNLCRDHGIECGPVDILICAVASRNRWSILTNDKGLLRCIAALREDGIPI